MKARDLALRVLLAVTPLACGETTKQAATTKPIDMPTHGGGADNGAGGEATVPAAPVCSSPQPGPYAMMGLENPSLRKTALDLLRDLPAVSAELERELGRLPADDADDGYDAPSIEALHLAARAVGRAFAADASALTALAGCAPAQSDEDVCREQLLRRLLRSAFRRPPTEDDIADMRGVFATGRQLGGDFVSGARAVLEVTLQSPEFLYLIEQGTGETAGDTVALTPHETAVRMAYFLTAGPPDAELAALADSGPLSEASLEEQARRLLETAAGHEVVRSFMDRLLGLDGSFGAHGPEYDAIAAFAREESARFVEDVTFEGAGTFEALFSEPSTWVNGPLAQLYGLPGVSGETFQRVALDATKRAGILTQAAFLASHPRPVPRGLAVLERLLCVPIEPPPVNVPATLPQPASMASQRQQLTVFTSQAECQQCHRQLDLLGFAFENFDALGRWRDTENGSLVDASGTLFVTDQQGSFGNAVELVQRIAASSDARACFASHWLEHAQGRPLSPADDCARQRLEAVLDETGGNIRELLVALARIDQFRYRLKSELLP